MMSGLVLVSQVGLLALVVLLGLRMLALARSQPLTTNPFTKGHSAFQKPLRPARQMTAEDRTALYTQLHILAGLQERECRVNGIELKDAPEPVRSYAAAWLYGAACALCDQHSRHSEALEGMVSQIASRKTGIRQSHAVQAMATLTSSSALLACFRGGLEGAGFWQKHHHVSPRHSLYEAITTNAFI
ncbi:hypothetical protein KFJ24_05960 [Marinobacter sediminum]|uniref:hypothetical protein n=1 Tax=Marinobacter sediminum TaxID=256323 RepID=UPI00202FB589|nr:hypothetical protein [Marinobacter sediminum]MCM0612020.1 hypothetical protein [Marinobacter sediminum]